MLIETMLCKEALHPCEENRLVKMMELQVSSSSTESRKTPLHVMLDAFGIDKCNLLIDEVRAEVSVVQGLEEVSHLCIAYEEEKRAYHHLYLLSSGRLHP